MKQKYFSELSALLKQIFPELSTTHRLEFKNIFGATAGYVNGQIFITQGKFGTAIKLSPKILNELLKNNNATPLKYFSKGHVKKEYAVLSENIIANERKLNELVGESIKYALLPKQKKD